MAAPRADCACDAELAPALSGEHDEDEEDQQDSRCDRERSECREHRHEHCARRVGSLECILFRVVCLEAERLDRRLQERDHAIRLRDAAGVHDEDGVHEPSFAEELLCRAEGHQDARAVGRAAGVAHDRADTGRHEALAHVHPDGVAGARVQLVGALPVEIDLARTQIRERDGLATGADVPETAELRRIAREERDTRLGLLRGQILSGDIFDDHGRDARDEAGGGGGLRDPTRVLLRDVPVSGRSVALHC